MQITVPWGLGGALLTGLGGALTGLCPKRAGRLGSTMGPGGGGGVDSAHQSSFSGPAQPLPAPLANACTQPHGQAWRPCISCHLWLCPGYMHQYEGGDTRTLHTQTKPCQHAR